MQIPKLKNKYAKVVQKMMVEDDLLFFHQMFEDIMIHEASRFTGGKRPDKAFRMFASKIFLEGCHYARRTIGHYRRN